MSDVEDTGFAGMRFHDRSPYVPRVEYGADDDTPTLTYRISERAAHNLMTILTERAIFGLGFPPHPDEVAILKSMSARFKRKLPLWAGHV